VNSKNKFGKNIEVKFNAGGPGLKSHWIGIYPVPYIDNSLTLWLYTCGSQDPEECTQEVTGEGTVIFRNEAPSSGRDQYFPISAGNYQACLFDDNGIFDDDGGNDQIGECAEFTVNALKKKKVKKSRLFPTKKKFSYGEPIPVTYRGKFAVANQWIGLYPNVSYKKEIPDADIWIFSGCGDRFGNQLEIGKYQCSKRRKKGTVEFSSTTLYSEEWPVPVGEYRVCIVYMWNEPFNRFKCGRSFEVVAVA